jgi:hypothetical protein
MDMTSSSRRTRRLLFPMLALTAGLVCVGVAAESAASAPPSGAIQKLVACMKARGYTGRPTQADRANAKYNTAHQACAKQAGLTGGAGAKGTNANMQRYIACMKKHGITISATKKPNRTSTAYKKANAACASLRAST